MAQTHFPLFLPGDSITVLNDSGTTAITAGDLVYSAANDDQFTGTASTARSSYLAGDIKVKKIGTANTDYKTFIGIAANDIAVDSYGEVYLEGVFVSPVHANTEAGNHIMAAATTANRVTAILDQGTTLLLGSGHFTIGKALTGGSATGKYIAWKLTY